MPDGFLVTLGDDTIDPGDTVANFGPSSFTSAHVLGLGQVNWTNGANSLTTSGNFHLTDTGDVFFVPGFGPFAAQLGGTAQVLEFSGTQPGLICFVGGTLIETVRGPVAVEDLRMGDLVETLGAGPLPILWIGRRTLTRATLAACPALQPIEIKVPQTGRVLRLSPQHAIYATPGGSPLLIRARQLARLDLPGVRQMRGVRHVDYHHILLPQHGIIGADGICCESLMPGPQALAGLTPESRTALRRIVGRGYGPPAAPYATLKALRALPQSDRARLLCPMPIERSRHAA